MSLVEVLVAGIVLLLVMVPMGVLLAQATSAAAQTRQRQAAIQLADSWVEILSNSQPPTGSDGSVLTNQLLTPVAPPGTVAPPSTLAGTTYTTQAQYVEASVNEVGQSDLCSSGQPPSPSHPGVIELRVVVSWNHGKQTVSDSTEINYPKPGLQTEGFLAINVTNSGVTDVNGNSAVTRLQAVPVTITQITGNPVLVPSAFTLYADQNGCIFAQVPVGTYTVSVNQPTSGKPNFFNGYSGTPPYVTTSGATSEQQTPLTVTVTAENVVQLDAFDEGIIGNVTYGGSASVDSGVQCPGAAGLTCVTTGSRSSGGSSAWGGAGAAWTSARSPNGSHINQVACTTAAAATCVGVGYSSTGGYVLSTATNFSATTTDTVPAGVTDISQVVCPSSTGCYALGATAAGAALLAGSVRSGGDTWAVVTPGGIPISTLNSIACPTSTTCELTYTSTTNTPGVIRLDGDPAGLAGSPGWVPTVTADGLPPTVLGISSITCPTSATCEAIATGDNTSASDATVITVPVAAAGASTWTAESTFPTGAASVTAMSCTATTCVAIGSLPVSGVSTPTIWTGDLTTASHNWVQANGFPPASVGAVTSVACGQPSAGDSADCVVSAISAGGSGSGLLFDGSLTGGSWAWNPISLPTGVAVQFFDGVACEQPPSAAAATCAAVGATLTGPIILSTSNGPDGTWANVTPASLPGARVTGIPIETAPAGTTSWTVQVAAGHANVSSLPNVLYPQSGGYAVVAGDCALEGSGAPAGSLLAAPGGTASTTIPLGRLSLKLVNAVGAPVSGAVITLTSTTCGASNTDSYNLPTTDAYGLSTTSVPYGSYSYTVTIGGSATAHTSVNLTVGSSTVGQTIGGSTVTTYLPNPVQVSA